MNKHTQNGSAHVLVTACLVVVLLFALGWIFWQNFVHKEAANKDTDTIVVDKTKTTDAQALPDDVNFASTESPNGITLHNAADVDKLDNISSDLKSYLKDQMALMEKDVDRAETTCKKPIKSEVTYTLIRVYKQNYAVGTAAGESVGVDGVSCAGGGAAFLWGKVDGSWREISGTQNIGFSCSDLEKYHVPAAVVDGKCSDGKSATAVTYNG